MDASGSKPAEELRGATCQATEAALKARLGADYQIASIGPAGERAVRYATISHDGRHAGRGGSGAVLGSKNIKAIAVRGTQRCEWAHPRELTEYSKNLSKRSFGPATAKYRELGTATNLLTFNRLGALPTRNFQSGTFDGAVSISPEEIRTTHSRTRASCVACTIGCEHIYAIGDENGVRLEYESLFALGSLCGVSDAGRRAPRIAAVRRPGHRHDQRRRHDRLRHGVRRTRMARRALAHVRERRRHAARDRADGPPRGHRQPAGRGQPPRRRRRSGTTASRSLRRSRASRFPATSRGRCRRWRWASPSARAAPITIAAAPTRSISRTRWTAGT